jgi:hypothetical protein
MRAVPVFAGLLIILAAISAHELATGATAAQAATDASITALPRRRGVGFRAPDVLTLLDHARRWRRPSSPFVGAPRVRGAVWVEPRLEGEVSYAGLLRAADEGTVVRRIPRDSFQHPVHIR